MAKITTKHIDNKKEWESFLEKHQEANFLQSWYWGEFHETLGHKIQRVGFEKNGEIVGVMLTLVEEAKRGKYLVVPGGPIIDWDDKEQREAFVEEIKRQAKELGCVFVRVRSQLVENDESRKIFKDLGFKKAPMYLHAELTSQLDIKPTEDELMANTRKTTRYEIRKAKNLGIQIVKNGDEYIKKFYELQLETAKRQSFVPFSRSFLEKQFDIFIKNGLGVVYTAVHENKILAQAFIIFYGSEAVYHYGASTDEGRRFPGAYLIQWEAILEAKRRGQTRYNFWGVSPIDETTHRFHGISIFKRGFGGVDVQYLPAQDFVINKTKYLFNFVIEKARRKIRNV